jgi:hypothetical protein
MLLLELLAVAGWSFPASAHDPWTGTDTAFQLTGAAVSYLLPARWQRTHQVFILSLEGYCIQRNLQIGISVRF